jgi:ATP-dependent DNA helicase DinG
MPVESKPWLEDISLGLVKEVRPSQVEMSKSVTQIFNAEDLNKSHVAFLEAGTGVGKSFAYLVPAIELALSDPKKRVVVATAQKNLQTQLVDKDLPFLVSKLGKVKYAILKGKGNYACKQRMADAEEAGATHVHLPQYGDFKKWTETDTLGDLETYPEQISFQSQVNVETCIGQKCQKFTQCGYQKARAIAVSAQIVVTNQALISLDLMFGGGKILGEYDALVIDEAHKAPKFFRDAFSNKLTIGVITQIERSLERLNMAIPQEFHVLKATLTELFSSLAASPRGDFYPTSQQLGLITTCAQMLVALRIKLKITDTESEGDTKYAMAVARLSEIFDSLEMTFNLVNCPTTEETEYHLSLDDEQNGYSTWLALKAVPIECGTLIGPALRGIGKVVVTSATLSAGGDFKYMATEFGFAVPQLERASQFSSSFDYKSHSLLYLTPSMPQYDYNNSAIYYNAAAKEIIDLINASRGGAFVLCASRADMEALAERVFPSCKDNDLTLLLQSKSVDRDIAMFKGLPNAVLFGLNSIWEGVDVPGLGLRLVIIPRIPFPNKSDSLLQARKRLAAQRLIDSGTKEGQANFKQFADFDVAIAALSLAQGSGRLIRSKDDFGVVAILDSRIVGNNKQYSSFLRRGLPHPVTTDKSGVHQYLARLAKKYYDTLNASPTTP